MAGAAFQEIELQQKVMMNILRTIFLLNFIGSKKFVLICQDDKHKTTRVNSHEVGNIYKQWHIYSFDNINHKVNKIN